MLIYTGMNMWAYFPVSADLGSCGGNRHIDAFEVYYAGFFIGWLNNKKFWRRLYEEESSTIVDPDHGNVCIGSLRRRG